MANHMPSFYIVLDANLIDLFGHMAQEVRIVRPTRCLPHSGQVYCKALEASAQALNDALPETTAGGHPVNEKYRNSGTATYKVHEFSPIELMKLHMRGQRISIARRTSKTSSLRVE